MTIKAVSSTGNIWLEDDSIEGCVPVKEGERLKTVKGMEVTVVNVKDTWVECISDVGSKWSYATPKGYLDDYLRYRSSNPVGISTPKSSLNTNTQCSHLYTEQVQVPNFNLMSTVIRCKTCKEELRLVKTRG